MLLALTRATLACCTLAMAVPGLRAQDVLLVWGDSIALGAGSDLAQGTPLGPAPFGDPVPGVQRWDPVAAAWGPLTPAQNAAGAGADLAYGFAAGYRRSHGGEVHLIVLAVAGSDAAPDPGSPLTTWHPSVPGGLFERFVDEHVAPALATLAQPRLRAVLFSAGNNAWTADLDVHVQDVNQALRALAPGSNPTALGVQTYFGTPNDANTVRQRERLAAWAGNHPRRRLVDAASVPARTGGLADLFHLTHYGTIQLGYLAALVEAG